MYQIMCEVDGCDEYRSIKMFGSNPKRFRCQKHYDELPFIQCAAVNKSDGFNFRCGRRTFDQETKLCSSHVRPEANAVAEEWEKCPNCGTEKVVGAQCPKLLRKINDWERMLKYYQNQDHQRVVIVFLDSNGEAFSAIEGSFSDKEHALEYLDDRDEIDASSGRGEIWDIRSSKEYDIQMHMKKRKYITCND